MPSDLELKFHKAMLGVHKSALADCGYNATRFLGMVSKDGGLTAAKTLLQGTNYSEGFTALWERGRLGISVEALVLKPPWSSLFTKEELAEADRRLRVHGFLDR